MNKNIYLSWSEQRIFKVISSLDVVFVDDMVSLFPDLKPHQINKIFSALASHGYLYRVKKGVYLVQQKPSDMPVIKNPYRIAQAMFNGYIGFSSALRIYDLLDYEPFTIFVVTKNKSREKSIGEYVFRSVAMGKRATGMTYFKGIYTSTLAKTFFDCFYKPHYGGGYSTITKALYEAELDWQEFLKYFEFASSSLCQRTGYVLDLMRETDKIPEEVLNSLGKKVKNNTKLIPSGKASGEYNKKWLVLDNLGKANILSWWKHG